MKLKLKALKFVANDSKEFMTGCLVSASYLLGGEGVGDLIGRTRSSTFDDM